MGPIKKNVKMEGCKKKQMITVEVKKEIIKKHQQGMRVTDIARFYKKSPSTICTILKKKKEIMSLDAAKGVTTISTKQRPRIMEQLEKLLLNWIHEMQLAGDAVLVTEKIICEYAKTLYDDLLSKQPNTSTEKEEVFKASRGWLQNFKKRTGIISFMKDEEAAFSAAEAAFSATEAFAAEFQGLIISESYLPQQVFNCVETGLFWKNMPKRTLLAAEEHAMPGQKSVKDCVTLLLCANASGDFKVKPLLVYHAENPRAFKQCKVQKNQLNVLWRSNSNALVTRIFFVEWINEVFGPTVKKYLVEKKLPLKVLLVLDDCPAHPPGLEDDLLEEFDFIKIKFLPKTTPLLQPMDHHFITNFKKLYTKALFQRCFEVTEGTNLTLQEFWKNHFNIVNCLKIIDKAWNGVTKKTINYAWRNLWFSCVQELASEQEPPLVEEIISLARIIGLEVNENDIQELVEDEGHDLVAEESMAEYDEQLEDIKYEINEMSSDEEEEKKLEESLSSNEIREMCKMWETLQNFVERHHPNKAVAVRAMNQFNDNAMSHFHEILMRRQMASNCIGS